jgi:Thrombospondin type 1 domain/Beta-propeller repeat
LYTPESVDAFAVTSTDTPIVVGTVWRTSGYTYNKLWIAQFDAALTTQVWRTELFAYNAAASIRVDIGCVLVAVDSNDNVIVAGCAAGFVYDGVVGAANNGFDNVDFFVASFVPGESGARTGHQFTGAATGSADKPYVILVDLADDSVFIGGSTTDMFGAQAYSNAGGDDAFVVKIDSTLNSIVWAYNWGNPANDRALAMALTSNSDVIVGIASEAGQYDPNGSLRLVKLSGSTGALLWGPVELTNYHTVAWDKIHYALAVNSADEIFLTGSQRHLQYPAGGIEQMYVRKFNSSGALVTEFVQDPPDIYSQFNQICNGFDVVVDTDDQVLAVARYGGGGVRVLKFNADLEAVWQLDFTAIFQNMVAVRTASDGYDTLIAGALYASSPAANNLGLTGNYGTDPYIVRLHQNPAVYVWEASKWFPHYCKITCGQGTQTRSRSCVNAITGVTVADSKCAPIPKPDATRTCTRETCTRDSPAVVAWGQSVSGINPYVSSQTQLSLAVDTRDNNAIVMGGTSTGSIDPQVYPAPSSSSQGSFMVKIDASGNELWRYQFPFDTYQLRDVRLGYDASGYTQLYSYGRTTTVSPSSGLCSRFATSQGAPNMQSAQLPNPSFANKDSRIAVRSVSGVAKSVLIADSSARLIVHSIDYATLQLEWTYSVDANSGGWLEPVGIVSDDSTQSIYVALRVRGTFARASTNSKDGGLLKLNADGRELWRVQINQITGDSEVLDTLEAIGVDTQSNVVVAGATYGEITGWNPTQGPKDAFVIKYDQHGTEQWRRQTGTRGRDLSVADLAIDTRNNDVIVLVTGGANIVSFADQYISCALVRWTADGAQVQRSQLGRVQYDYSLAFRPQLRMVYDGNGGARTVVFGASSSSFSLSNTVPSSSADVELQGSGSSIFAVQLAEAQGSVQWHSSAWTACSVTCGNGTQTRDVFCQDSVSHLHTFEANCEPGGSKPASQQVCRMPVCSVPYVWYTGSFGTCSVDCTQSRVVACHNATGFPVDDSMCANAASKPISSQPCSDGLCTFAWNTTEFSTCSSSCTQSRSVACVNSAGAVVDDSMCSNAGSRPVSSQSCTAGSCTFAWHAYAFDVCKVNCTQSRSVTCRNSAGSNVDDAMCTSAGSKPVSSQTCSDGLCTVSWNTTSFSTCSASCTQSRYVACHNSGGSVVDESACSNAGSKPVSSQPCSDGLCTFAWNTTEFSTCSSSCTQSRSVACVNSAGAVVTEAACADTGSKPPSLRNCADGLCTFLWATTSFSSCSVGCSQSRVVICRNSAGEHMTDSMCSSSGAKPAVSRSCAGDACIPRQDHFFLLDCTSLADVFGNTLYNFGVTSLDGECVFNGGSYMRLPWTSALDDMTHGVFTAMDVKVTSSYYTFAPVLEAPDPTWTFGLTSDGPFIINGVLSDCSATGLSGFNWFDWNAFTWDIRSSARTIKWNSQVYTCSNGGSVGAASSDIEIGRGPFGGLEYLYGRIRYIYIGKNEITTSQIQSLLVQPAWHVESYSTCSASCTQTRFVACRNYAGLHVADSMCLHDGVKPAVSQACSGGLCRFYWHTEAFGTCSSNCTQSRIVTCRNSTGSDVDPSLCIDAGSKPALSQSCSGGLCTFAWHTAEFSTCSSNCTQSRSVTCRNSIGTSVDDSFCIGAGSKPASSQSCSGGLCTFAWHAAEFSTCSSNCTQSRSVTCRNSGGADVSESFCTDAGAKPAVSQSCTGSLCTFSWYSTPFSTCSAECTKSQFVSCRNSGGVDIADSFCHNVGSKPASSTSCLDGMCTFTWNTTPYGTCYSNCTQSRSVTCHTFGGSHVPEMFCSHAGSKPVSSQSCSSNHCTFSWNTTAFTTCSSSCTQSRLVSCRSSAGITVADSFCIATISKPASLQSCSGGSCDRGNSSIGTLNTIQFGRSTQDVALAIAVDPSNRHIAYAAGGTIGSFPGFSKRGGEDVFVTKYDMSTTTRLWAFQTGTSNNDIARGVAVDSAGNVLVAGETSGAFPGFTNANPDGWTDFGDVFMMKVSASGSLVWVFQTGSPRADTTNAVAVDSVGNAYCAGHTNGNFPGFSYDPVISYERTYTFVVKVNPSGTHVWTTQVGNDYHDDAYGITVDLNDDIYVSASTCGGWPGFTDPDSYSCSDMVALKFSSSGSLLWAHQLGFNPPIYSNGGKGYAIAADSQNNVIMAGTSTPISLGKILIAVVKLSASGALVWTSRNELTPGVSFKEIQVRAVAIDSTDHVFVSGHTTGSLPGSTNLGEVDIFVAKLDPMGTFLWVYQTGNAQVQYAYGLAVDNEGNAMVAGSTEGVLPGSSYKIGDWVPGAYIMKVGDQSVAWYTSSFGMCSDVCTQTRSVYCRDASTGDVVDESICSATTVRPPATFNCDDGNCTHTWNASNTGGCSAACTQTRTLLCMNSGGMLVHDSTCIAAGNPKPAYTVGCTTGDCSFSWNVSIFGVCDSNCQHTRSVGCLNTSSGNHVADSLCVNVGAKPTSVQACSGGECIFAWYTTSFSSCSANCTQSRYVRCRNPAQADVADVMCSDAGTKPATSRTCGDGQCIVAWHTGAFAGCSTNCTQSRSVACRNSVGADVDASFCASSGSKPASEHACSDGLCKFAWHTGSFSLCSADCSQLRSVVCRNSAGADTSDSMCTNAGIKPASSQACSDGQCEFVWHTGSFSLCSADCSQLRSVVCRNSAGADTSDSMCMHAGAKPTSAQACSDGLCTFSWNTTAFSSCTADCTQSRSVSCRSSNGTDVVDSFCSGVGSKPVSSQSCSGAACPEYSWVPTSWGVCLLNCSRLRTVECFGNVLGTLTIADNSKCASGPLVSVPLSQSCVGGLCIPLLPPLNDTTPVQCPQRYYCDARVSSAPILCPAGASCRANSSRWEMCARGTFSNSTGLSVCEPCPDGYTTLTVASTSREDCILSILPDSESEDLTIPRTLVIIAAISIALCVLIWLFCFLLPWLYGECRWHTDASLRIAVSVRDTMPFFVGTVTHARSMACGYIQYIHMLTGPLIGIPSQRNVDALYCNRVAAAVSKLDAATVERIRHAIVASFHAYTHKLQFATRGKYKSLHCGCCFCCCGCSKQRALVFDRQQLVIDGVFYAMCAHMQQTFVAHDRTHHIGNRAAMDAIAEEANDNMGSAIEIVEPHFSHPIRQMRPDSEAAAAAAAGPTPSVPSAAHAAFDSTSFYPSAPGLDDGIGHGHICMENIELQRQHSQHHHVDVGDHHVIDHVLHLDAHDEAALFTLRNPMGQTSSMPGSLTTSGQASPALSEDELYGHD